MNNINFEHALSHFDHAGQEVLNNVQHELQNKGMSLAFDSQKMEFIILNSRDYSDEDLKEALKGKKIEGWTPHLLETKTYTGDHIMTLEKIGGLSPADTRERLRAEKRGSDVPPLRVDALGRPIYSTRHGIEPEIDESASG